ncbi:MAG TPA: hypothetical protein VFV74_04645, partial [Burkholderiales bacterium]|nr:hypothetical protein [Burkholderiales bacterium]
SLPAIATWFPEKLQAESRAVKTEAVEGGATLEDYESGYGQALDKALEQESQPGDPLEQDELPKNK